MKYITGIHALNLPCSLDTCGDWHTSALDWGNVKLEDSNKHFFREYGIEKGRRIPNNNDTYYVANHIRALLDLLEINMFSIAQGMNKDFIGNDKYTEEIFRNVYEMRYLPNWIEIDQFMGREYFMEWINFKGEKDL